MDGLDSLDIDKMDVELRTVLASGDKAKMTKTAQSLCERLTSEFEKPGSIEAPMLKSMSHTCVFIGALVEKGANADTVGKSLIDSVVAFLDVINDVQDTEAGQNPHLAVVLKQLELCFVAVFGRASAKARKELLTSELGTKIRKETIELRWNARIMHHTACLLDEEPLLILAPGETAEEQPYGVKVVIRGVSNNAQLVVLLTDQLKRKLGDKCAFPAPKERFVKHMAGEEEQGLDSLDEHYIGTVNMYNYFALNPMKRLRGSLMGMPTTDSWVWVEGIPADIEPCPVLEGSPRVVLLGRPPYERRIALTREVSELTASVEIVEVLSAKQTKAALDAIAAISNDEREAAANKVRQETNVGREQWLGRPDLGPMQR